MTIELNRQLAEAMQHVAIDITSVQGENVLRDLARFLCQSLGVDFALIGRGQDGDVEALAVCDRGESTDSFSYPLEGTPCAAVWGGELRIVSDGLMKQFPGNNTITRNAFTCYAGLPLFDTAGEPIGIIAVLSRSRFGDEAMVAALLRMFAVRAAAELERLRNEAAVHEAESSYRAIFDAAEDPIFVHDWDSGEIVDVNAKACEVFGYSREQLVHSRIGDLGFNEEPYTVTRARERIEQAKREGSVQFEWRRRAPDGSLHWDEVRLKRAVISGKPRVLAFTREITERKQAEEALRASEEQYRAIFNACADALIMWDSTLHVVDVNVAYEKTYGWTREEVLHPDYHRVFTPEFIRARIDMVRRTLNGESCLAVLDSVRKSGERFPAEVQTIPFVHRGEPHVLAIVRDITHPVEQQRKLVQSEQRLRATVASSRDCIVAVDPAGRIVEFNPRAEATFRIAAADAIGREMAELIIPPRLREAHRAGMARYLATSESRVIGQRLELRAQRADGEEFDAELVISLADGEEGRIFIAFLNDVTEQKAAQLQREQLQAQLRQAQKMEAIGHLAGGIAHDFNNLLTSLTGYVAMAQERLNITGEEKAGRYLEKSLRSAERARSLVHQLLVFSRGQRGARVAVDLARHLPEFEELLRSTLPSSVQFRSDYQRGLPAVMVDPTQLDQVLMNLCINARDAMESHGTLQVGLHGRQLHRAVCSACRKEVSGEFIELSVTDTGHGIPPEVLECIFDPFFTTKQAGKGTGMGLSTTHGIVHEYGGHLLVDTEPGRGTSFRVLLPCAETSTAGRPDLPAGAVPARFGNTLEGAILLVDDDSHVLEYMEEQLCEWGLTVHAFLDPRTALAAVSSGEVAFGVAVVDQTMPGMSGLKLARALTELLPDPRIVLYTGYSEPIDRDECRDCYVIDVLHKPIDHAHLHRLLRENLPSHSTR